VAGLNEATFAALSTVKQRNPGSLTERDAQEISAAARSWADHAS